MPIPDIRWIDGAKLLFKTKLHLDSTIYTQVVHNKQIMPWSLLLIRIQIFLPCMQCVTLYGREKKFQLMK